MYKYSVSVILPAFNEGDNIAPLVDKVARTFQTQQIKGEVIIINDGSLDHTREEAEKAKERYPFVKVFHHRRNLGLSEALMTGFHNVTQEVVIFLCSDLQSDPEEDIPKLLAGIEEGYDVVTGWRQGRKEGKIYISKIYHLLNHWLFGITAHDINWIKAFKREVMDELQLRSDWHRYIIVIAAHKGFKIKEVKTNYYPRQYGQSKYGKKRILRGFLDLLVVKFELSFRNKPMLLFGSIGFFLIGLALVCFMGLSAFYLRMGYGYRPLLMLILLLILAGIQLLGLGFMSELIVSLTEKMDSIKKQARDKDKEKE